MVTRPMVMVVVCVGFLLILHSLVPKVMALKKSHLDPFMMEGRRTQRENYMVQRARDKEIRSFENEVGYDMEPFDPDRNPEELSAFIVDNANIIRNDVIPLDETVETRTRKRGNIKVKKLYNQVITDLPCYCETTEKTKNLGVDVFPPEVQTITCNKSQTPFDCRENIYNLTILKNKKTHRYVPGDEAFKIHNNLSPNWFAVVISISVGCTCRVEYVRGEDV